MEIMLVWFWVIKLIFILIVIYTTYIAIKYKFKSKFWNILTLFMWIITLIMPVKMDLDTVRIQNLQDSSIEQQRQEVPPRITDNSFEEKSQNVQSITKEDLK